ncbi:glycine-rich protein 1 isoform X2 [Panicum miliaceum]|uniref:Glycine-rich protein 1 isoform X2 n=1 Tax=Panicum miliaceum TaxID=4540 RepID=A0A3L6RD78_PANMI|nr:glycine-rich protein 1 isoform X2 [Panicum miliaceum]
MDSGREVEDEWFGGDYDSTAATNDGLDFFNQAPRFHTTPLHYGGHRSFPRHGATAVQGLDLNSQAMDITDNMSCMDILRSSPDGLVMEGNYSGAGRGASRATERGAGRAAGHGAGAVRGTGRATSAPTSVVADHDIRVPSRPSRGAQGCGRAALSRPPAATSSCQFRPPHLAGGQSNTGIATHGVADATFDGGLHDPTAFNWSQDPYDEDDDDAGDRRNVILLCEG